MSVVTHGTARIRHSDTGVVYSIDPDELDWDVNGSDEREMGPEITHEAAIKHPDLGTLTWWLYEYPIGAENDRDYDIGRHQMVENFHLGLGGLPDEDRADSVGEMVNWFLTRFEDPTNRMPYNGREGGFQYIYGGPYDAREELSEAFPSAGDRLIDIAVDQIESDGITQWAPVARPEDYDDRDEAFDDLAADTPIEDLLAAVPEPGPGPVVGSTELGRIDVVGWNGGGALDADLRGAVQALASDLLAQLEGTNAHQDLLGAVRRYAEAVEAEPPSVSQLYTRGVFLEHTADQGEREIRADDRPPLPGSAPGALASLRELHGALIMSTPAGRALVEAAARYRMGAEAQGELVRAAETLADAIRQTPEVFGPVVTALAEEAAGNLGKGVHPERSNQIGASVVRAIMTGVIGAVSLAVTATTMTIVGDGLAATTIGSQTQAGVTVLGNAAWTFLVNNVDVLRTLAAVAASDLGWMRPLTTWIIRRR